jgi:tetratricopeptide (TPR) repeat protein
MKKQTPQQNLRYALLCAATVAAYLPALRGAFLWDDDAHVTQPALQSLDGLRRIWLEPSATQQYYPLLHSAFWLEHRLWGGSVLGYHLLNVLLHALAACLGVALARRLSLAGAWLAGFVFALHPVAVEAVAWISEQKSTLSAVLVLAAALAYLRFDEKRRSRWYAIASALFVASLLAKTLTAALPAVVLVLFWWKRGRIVCRRDVLPLIPWFALSLAAGATTAYVERRFVGAEGPDFALSAADRVLVAGRAVWFYATKVVWPANLMFTYPRWAIDAHQWWQWLYPAAVVAAGLLLWAMKRRGALAAFLIFVGTLFPALGFFNVYPFRFSFVADHFQYLACFAVIMPACTLLARWEASAVIPLVLAVLTFQQARIYKNAETLYRETLARNPASWMAEHNLCTLLLADPRRTGEAIDHCQAAVRIQPDHAEAHNNLGVLLTRLPGRMADAEAQFEAALRAKPSFAQAHLNLGNALVFLGRPAEGLTEYQAALRMQPDYLEARMNLGATLTRLRRFDDAIAEFQTALRARPDLALVHYNLAIALQGAGRAVEAAAEFQKFKNTKR